MGSNLEKIKQVLSDDKRSCDRLDLSLGIRYTKLNEAGEKTGAWSDVVWLDNIGGEGLGFSDDAELPRGTKVEVELRLSAEGEPFYLMAEVVWVSQNFNPETETRLKKFSYGLKISQLKDDDRKRLGQFISENIFNKYLDDKGQLRDI